MTHNKILNWWITDEGNKKYNESLVIYNNGEGLGFTVLDNKHFVEFTSEYRNAAKEEAEIEYLQTIGLAIQ